MQLRNRIVLPRRYAEENDDEFISPKNAMKPAFPRLLASQVVPFNPNLPRAAFPSILDLDSPQLRSAHPAEPQKTQEATQTADVEEFPFPNLDQSRYATKIDWQNSNDATLHGSTAMMQSDFLNDCETSDEDESGNGKDEDDLCWGKIPLAMRVRIYEEVLQAKNYPDPAIALGIDNQEVEEVKAHWLKYQIQAQAEEELSQEMRQETLNSLLRQDYSLRHYSVGIRQHNKLTEKYLSHMIKPNGFDYLQVTLGGFQIAEKFLRQRGLEPSSDWGNQYPRTRIGSPYIGHKSAELQNNTLGFGMHTRTWYGIAGETAANSAEKRGDREAHADASMVNASRKREREQDPPLTPVREPLRIVNRPAGLARRRPRSLQVKSAEPVVSPPGPQSSHVVVNQTVDLFAGKPFSKEASSVPNKSGEDFSSVPFLNQTEELTSAISNEDSSNTSQLKPPKKLTLRPPKPLMFTPETRDGDISPSARPVLKLKINKNGEAVLRKDKSDKPQPLPRLGSKEAYSFERQLLDFNQSPQGKVFRIRCKNGTHIDENSPRPQLADIRKSSKQSLKAPPYSPIDIRAISISANGSSDSSIEEQDDDGNDVQSSVNASNAPGSRRQYSGKSEKVPASPSQQLTDQLNAAMVAYPLWRNFPSESPAVISTLFTESDMLQKLARRVSNGAETFNDATIALQHSTASSKPAVNRLDTTPSNQPEENTNPKQAPLPSKVATHLAFVKTPPTHGPTPSTMPPSFLRKTLPARPQFSPQIQQPTVGQLPKAETQNRTALRPIPKPTPKSKRNPVPQPTLVVAPSRKRRPTATAPQSAKATSTRASSYETESTTSNPRQSTQHGAYKKTPQRAAKAKAERSTKALLQNIGDKQVAAAKKGTEESGGSAYSDDDRETATESATATDDDVDVDVNELT